MQKIARTVLVLTALGGSGTAGADEKDKDIERCGNFVTNPPADVIAACTRLLNDSGLRQSWPNEDIAIIFANRGYAYFSQGDHPKALTDLDFAVVMSPKYVFGLMLRGRISAGMQRHQDAIDDYTKCLRLKPRDEACLQFRGMSHYALGRHAQALRDLSAAIQVNPKNASAHAFRGSVYDKMGQRQAAIRDYRAAMRLGSRDEGVPKRLAELESQDAPAPPATGAPDGYREACFNPPNPQAGIAACTRRIQAGGGGDAKGQSDTFNSRAWWRYKAGQYQTALADVNRAIALDPNSAPAYDTRGHIHSALGRRDDAIRDFRQALSLNPRTDTHRSAESGLRALGASVSHPPGTPVNLTWRFRNNSGGTVHVKMYARDRGIWWPGAHRNWRMDDVGPYSFTISCRAGENVCYGAWQSGNTALFWGTGFEDRNSCSACCYACFEGQTTIYNLSR